MAESPQEVKLLLVIDMEIYLRQKLTLLRVYPLTTDRYDPGSNLSKASSAIQNGFATAPNSMQN